MIIDDTDFRKTGHCIELIGRVYSHLTHSSYSEFKGLFGGYYDGGKFLFFGLQSSQRRKKKHTKALCININGAITSGFIGILDSTKLRYKNQITKFSRYIFDTLHINHAVRKRLSLKFSHLFRSLHL